MDLRVDDEAMKSVMAKAIVDAITPEARTKLITDAVTAAITPTDRYGGKRSPLQQAFDYAVETEARRFATEVVQGDPIFREQLQKLFADVAKKIFETETRDAMVESLANTIVRALTKDRY